MSTQAWTVQVDGAPHRITVDTDAEHGRASIRVDGKMATRPVNAEEEEREFPVGSMIYVLRRLPDQTFDLDIAATSGAAISATAGKPSALERREARARAKRPRRLAIAAVMGVIVMAVLWWAWDSTAYMRVPWKEWYSTEARVRVEFPGDPEGGVTKADRGSERLESGSFHATYREHGYVLEHHDLGAPLLERDAGRILTEAVKAVWKHDALEQLSDTRISNRDAIQFVVRVAPEGEQPAKTIRGVATVHQRQMVLAWVETPPGELQEWDVDHFLHSVRLPFEYAYDAQGQLRMPDMPNFNRKVPLKESMNLRLTALFARFAVAVVAFLIGYRSWKMSLSN